MLQIITNFINVHNIYMVVYATTHQPTFSNAQELTEKQERMKQKNSNQPLSEADKKMMKERDKMIQKMGGDPHSNFCLFSSNSCSWWYVLYNLSNH